MRIPPSVAIPNTRTTPVGVIGSVPARAARRRRRGHRRRRHSGGAPPTPAAPRPWPGTRPRRSRRAADPARVDHGEAGAVGLDLGQRVDAVALDRQHELGDLQPVDLGLARAALHEVAVAAVLGPVDEGRDQVDHGHARGSPTPRARRRPARAGCAGRRSRRGRPRRRAVIVSAA